MGYVHDTNMSQFIPPAALHYVGGTWSDALAITAAVIAKTRVAAAATTVINVPILIPQNSVALKGGKLASVEFDYEISTAAATSITATMNKITRGVDTAISVVANVPVTQDLVAATDAADIDTHRLKVTVTTPVWLDNDEYFLLVITAVCALTTVLDVMDAVANFTLRV